MTDVSMKTTVQDIHSRIWEKFAPHWQRIQQWSPVQRRMLIIVSVLLIVNIVLMAKISTPQPEVGEKAEVNKYKINI